MEINAQGRTHFTAQIVASLTLIALPCSLPAQAQGSGRIPLTEIASILERAKQIHTHWKSSGRVFPDQEKHFRARRMPVPAAPIGSQSCCSTWQGFDFTGLLAVAPTDPNGPISCGGCVPGALGPSLGVPAPQGIAFQGLPWSTVMTFHSTIPGPCTVTFLWFKPPIAGPIQGFQGQINDCGTNAIWFNEFFGFIVPAVGPGNAVAVGIIQASNGTTDVDFEQFAIQ
jgi:hypothetical protein